MDCWYTAAYNIYNKAEDNEIKRIFKKYIVMSELEQKGEMYYGRYYSKQRTKKIYYNLQ